MTKINSIISALDRAIDIYNAKYRTIQNHGLVELPIEIVLDCKQELLSMQSLLNKEWLPIESAPKNTHVLLFYKNGCGRSRIVRGIYYTTGNLPMHDDYDSDDGFAPENWYEENDAEEVIYALQEEPTHWQPLPPAPIQAINNNNDQGE